MRRAHLRVTGRVQGVFFRSELRDRALSLGIAGWARNKSDGSLEAVLEGDEERLDTLLRWCERGPAGARVDAVDVTDEKPQGDEGFAIVS